MWLGRNAASAPGAAPQFSGGTRLAQQPDAVAAANAADRSRRIRSTAYTADRAGRIAAAYTANRAGGIRSAANAADWARRVTGAYAANRSGWIGSSSTWHNGFSFAIIQVPGT
jgi:hypothetical protein